MESLVMLPSKNFWSEKRVLVSGHNGFKGTWLSLLLNELGAKVSGFSIFPYTNPSLSSEVSLNASISRHEILDIRDAEAVRDFVRSVDPQFVFHLAAQPLVRKSYQEVVETFDVNVQGTVHLLNALRQCKSLLVAVCITSDKVYLNMESSHYFSEKDPLGGYDPYSSSKVAMEAVIDCFRQSFFEELGIRIFSARAGNVIGGGDWADDRILPDAVKSWTSFKPLSIRNPQAIRPWQHVLEPLRGYLLLAEQGANNTRLSSCYNFGPNCDDTFSVMQLINTARKYFPKSIVEVVPEQHQLHEADLLMLDNSMASRDLGYTPVWLSDRAIEKACEWYLAFSEGEDARNLCARDINEYLQDCDVHAQPVQDG